MKKLVADHQRDWDAQLTAALWAYRTAYKVTTGHTPFHLMYGIEAKILPELEIQSLTLALHYEIGSNIDLSKHLAELVKSEEVREISLQRIAKVQNQRKERIDKERKIHDYKVGEYVLWCRKTEKYSTGKLESRWEGPYLITKVYENGVIEIADEMEGVVQSVNGNKLKPYFIRKDGLHPGNASVQDVNVSAIYIHPFANCNLLPQIDVTLKAGKSRDSLLSQPKCLEMNVLGQGMEINTTLESERIAIPKWMELNNTLIRKIISQLPNKEELQKIANEQHN